MTTFRDTIPSERLDALRHEARNEMQVILGCAEEGDTVGVVDAVRRLSEALKLIGI